MRPNTPKRIQPRRLLLNPNGSPVPSVLNLSSTKAIAGLDMVAAITAAAKDPPLAMFELLSFFPSIEQLTLPFLASDGKAKTVEDGAPADGLCTRLALTTDEAAVLAVMVAISV